MKGSRPTRSAAVSKTLQELKKQKEKGGQQSKVFATNGIHVLKLETPMELAQDYQKKRLHQVYTNMRNSKIESMMLKTTSQEWNNANYQG